MCHEHLSDTLADTDLQRARLAQVNAELHQARDAAVSASSARDAFFAAVTHELRTPLVAILGYTELVRESLPERGIADTGVGIPEGQLETIFEAFAQASNARASSSIGKSTGLGLAITRQLVQAMGGRIEVTSTLGVGTTFSETLPIAP